MAGSVDPRWEWLGFLLPMFLAWHVLPGQIMATAMNPSSFALGPQISSLNLLLLPSTTRVVRYRLQGFNGCFIWSQDHEDLISLEPEVNQTTPECSTAVIITSIASYTVRRSTTVQATDTITGQVLRCEVFIDKISQIRIFHQSRKLDLHGLATFSVQAFDAEGNVFSSLLGLQFLWTLEPVNGLAGGTSPRLVHVPLTEASLSDVHSDLHGDGYVRVKLEEGVVASHQASKAVTSNLGADLYVVKGVSVGQERVTVQVNEPQFENLADSVVLTVAEAISLSPPSPLYIAPGMKLQYTLKRMLRNNATVVELPSKNYEWSVANKSVAEIDSRLGLLTALNLGRTEVRVRDLRVEGHEQISMLYVVMPTQLKLYLSPLPAHGTMVGAVDTVSVPSDGVWQLVVGRKYVVQVLAFSKESGTKPILITKDSDLQLFYMNKGIWETGPIPEGLATSWGWWNGTLLRALKDGTGKLRATLGCGVVEKQGTTGQWKLLPKPHLEVEQQVQVCDPVKIVIDGGNDPGMEDRVLRLPWVPKQPQQYLLTAMGGCGPGYRWTSSNPSIMSVSVSGLVRAVGTGKATVKAAALNNPLNVDEMEAEMSYPATMTAVPGLVVETEVGSTLPVAVTVHDATGSAYSACDAISSVVEWKITSSGTVFIILNRTNNSSLVSVHGNLPTGGLGLVPKSSHSYNAALTTIPKGACASALFWASRPGRARVFAVLEVVNLDGEGWAQPPKLEASWTVAAYPLLTIEQVQDGRGYGGYGLSQEDGQGVSSDYVAGHQSGGQGALVKESEKPGGLKEILLGLGCSLRVELKGGPERWRPGFDFVEDSEVVRLADSDSSAQGGAGGAGGKAPPAGLEVGSDRDGLIVDHLAEGLGRTFLLECELIGMYRVTFYRGNILNPDQPRNSVANSTLVVMCQVPASIVVLIDDQWNHPVAIAESAQLEREASRLHTGTHMLVSGRKVRVAAVALDAASRPFANASSLQLVWHLEDCEVAEWGDLPEGEARRKSSVGPWERWLALKDKDGQCVVRATVGDLVRPRRASLMTLKEAAMRLKASQSQLTDAARLQLVTALRLEPAFLLLFWHPASKGIFKVIGGTSDIQASMNSSWVAEVVHVPGTAIGVSTTLQVIAKSKGVAEVVVRDVGLVHPAMATAIVTVADVVWVRLMLPEEPSLQLGSNMSITVQAGDIGGRVFDPAQFKLMDLKVHLQDEILTLIGIGEAPWPGGSGTYPANTFRVMGSSVGVTSGLRVSVQLQSGEKVYSEFVRITVYAPLVINPPWLVLAPGAQFMVLVSGGPRVGVVIQFESSNKTVGTVHSSQGNILALSEGNMTLHATAIGYGGQWMSAAAIPVLVRIPTSMALNVRSGRLGVGKEMSVFPVGSLEGEGLFSFGQLCTDYRWSVEDEEIVGLHSVAVPGEGANLYESSRQTSIVCPEGEDGYDACRGVGGGSDRGLRIDIGFSAHLHGKSPGRSIVSVTLTCHFHGASAPKEYTARNMLWVVPDPPLALGLSCTWLLPVHYTSSVLLPYAVGGSSSSSVDLLGRSSVSKRTSVYSIMQSGGTNGKVIAIEGGKIRTGSRPDVTCIQETEQSTGRVEVAVCVRTAEVAQILVNDKEPPYHAVDLSIGASQGFAVSLRDEIGSPFYEAQQRSMHLVVESNQPQVASAALVEEEGRDSLPANTTLVIQALHQGTALIRVRLAEGLEISDYVAVQVGAYVSPRNPTVHVGGRINFTIGGRAAGFATGERGKWVSGNESVLKVNPHTGKAEAVGKGTTRVFFTGSRITVDTTVSVVQVASLSINKPEESGPITNIGDKAYLFPVSFSYRSGQMDGPPKDQSIAFTCELDPPYIGRVSSRRDPESGQSYCVLQTYPPVELEVDMKEQSRLWRRYEAAGAVSGSVPLTVSAIVEGPSGSLVKDSVTVNFIGGFALAKETPSGINLLPRLNRTMVVLVGSIGSVDVSWTGRDVLSVRDISRLDETAGLAGKARFEVKVVQQAAPFTDVLVFTSRESGQKLELPVAFKVDGEASDREFSFVYVLVTTILAATGIIMLVWVCAWSMDQPQVIPPPPAGSVLSPPGRAGSPGTPPPSVAGAYGRTTPSRDLAQPSFDAMRSPSPVRAGPQSPPYTEHLTRTIQRTPYFDRDMARRYDPTRTY